MELVREGLKAAQVLASCGRFDEARLGYESLLERYGEMPRVAALRDVALRASRGEGRFPNAVLIGAQKAATTFCHDLVAAHPEATVMDPRLGTETHFFDVDANFACGPAWYQALFPASASSHVVFEKTPSYLYAPRVPGRLLGLLPTARLVAILRDPVQRAWSHYRMLLQMGKIAGSFEDAIDRQLKWLEGHTVEEAMELLEKHFLDGRKEASKMHVGIIARGLYVQQIRRWLRYANPKQLLILEFSDLISSDGRGLEVLGSFLELELPASAIHEARQPVGTTPLSGPTAARLGRFYAPFNQSLSDLVGREFAWSDNVRL